MNSIVAYEKDIELQLDFLRSFKKQKTIMFSQLIPSPEREDKVMTFIPLLHLTKQRKINLEQKEHFGDIRVELYENG